MSSHEFDRKKWVAMSLFDQMGNIGSEVGRAMNAIRRGDDASLEGAYLRGLDLIDASLDELSQPRKKELLRAREEFSRAVEDKEADSGLEIYFMEYAIAARLRKFV